MKFAVVTVLILSLFVSAMSIRCYTCDSITTSGCSKDDFDPSKASNTTCDEDEVCLKSVVGNLVVRGCVPGGTSDICYSAQGAESCYCSADLCNSAVTKHLGFALAFISLVTAKYL